MAIVRRQNDTMCFDFFLNLNTIMYFVIVPYAHTAIQDSFHVPLLCQFNKKEHNLLHDVGA